jgi:glycosyltransferase involved in cell wall biosynthesis
LLWAEAAIALAQQKPKAQFLMVGDGPLSEAVAARFAEADLAASLHMPGQVENVPDYLAAMDLFWLTSKTEGLPNVLIEAQFSGVPIVAFDVGGVGETFLDGETGALVPPNDVEALVARSKMLLEDDVWCAEVSRKSNEQALSRFSSTAFFDGLSRLYAA